jgi:hypothetical protein
MVPSSSLHEELSGRRAIKFPVDGLDVAEDLLAGQGSVGLSWGRR